MINHRQSVLLFLPLLALSLLLAGCGPEQAPTATPTKTVAPAVLPLGPGPDPATPTPPPAQPTQPPVPTNAPAANPPAAVNEEVGTVTADQLNVRSEPSTSGALIKTVNLGYQFKVVQRSPDSQWLQVAENGQPIGWVAAEYVQVQSGQLVAQGQPTAVPVATPPPAQGSQPPPAAVNFTAGSMASPDFGAQAFLWWRPEVADRDLGLMADGGFHWVKQSFAWETIEGTGPGQFDWSLADRVVKSVNGAQLQLLARLSVDPDKASFWAGPPPANGDAFARFAGAVAARYSCQAGAVGCIQAFQVWNEPNLAREWGGVRPNPAQYVEFLRKAYAAIKQANPNAIVINAGMAPTGSNDNNAMPDDIFYDEMYRAMGGSSNGYFDMLGVHGAGFAAPPELDPAEAAANKAKYGGYRFFAFRHVEDIRAIMVKYGDANKKIVLLEFGWTFDSVNAAYKWHGADAGITDQVQGQYLKRAYEYAAANWQPWIGLMSMLTMPNLDWLNDGNPQDEEQYWWAIMEPSAINEKKFRAAYIILCDYFNRQRGAFCPYDPARPSK